MFRSMREDRPPNKFTLWMGAKVRAARNEAGLSQGQLADLTYTHINTIGKIENGKVEPTITTLMLIASSLQKPITYFLPMPAEYRAAEDELPQWIRECVIHLRRIQSEHYQKSTLAMIKLNAELEEKEDVERTRESSR